MYCDGGGLYLQVTKGTEDAEGTQGINRSWIFRYTLNGRTREMGLGPTHTVTLAEARERARQQRHLLLDGIDPIEAKRAARAQAKLEAAKAMTFKECADAYVASHRAGWRNAVHAAQWKTTLATYAYPIIGALPVQAIDTQLVLKVLQQPVEAKRGEPAGEFWQARPETASRLRGRIEAVLDFATARRDREGANPAAWKNNLAHLLPPRSKLRKVKHHAALPYGDLPAFLVELREQQGIAARALEFLILTAARAGEVLGMTWNEVDLADATWTVPAERMKAGKEHRVPLSARALAILEEMQTHRTGNDAYVFPGGKPRRGLSNTTLLEVLQGMGRGDITAHGFRSTFKTWCDEQTNYPHHVVEQALAHTVGSAVERAYRRTDLFEKRRRLMQQWATFCTAPAQEPQNNIAVLRQKS
jgi:integrase